MATPLDPNSAKPINPIDYPSLVLKSYENNGGEGSLFYIGKNDDYGLLKKVSITGKFSKGSPQSYFSIIILPPSGEQIDFLENHLKDIVINEKKVDSWIYFDFLHSHEFLVDFENLSIQLEKNSDIFLYLFGAKTSVTSLTTPNLDIKESKIMFEGDFY